MSNQEHIIKKQIIELQLSSQQGAFELQNEVSRIYHRKVVPLLEALCDQLSDNQTIVRIDSLDINLGEVDINHLEQEIVAKVEAYVQQYLAKKNSPSDYIVSEQTQSNGSNIFRSNIDNYTSRFPQEQDSNTKKPPASNISNQSTTQLEILSYFLQTGMLPWWAKNVSQRELIEYCDRLITTSPNQVQLLVRQSLQNEAQLKRLIYQFPDATLLKITHLFAPSLTEFITNYASDITEIFKQIELLSNIPKNLSRVERWQGLFSSLSFQSSVNRDKVQVIKATLLYIAASLQINYFNLINQMLEAVEEFSREGRSFKSELPEILTQIATSSLGEEVTRADNSSTNFQPSIESFSDSDEVYIHNSGLILLWPFLTRFFEEIELLQANNFINSNSAERAVLLLQYLVDASTTPPEHLLPLNKLLCGIDLLEPVDTNWEITAQEQAECEELLCAVIQNWSILKNTSIAGLRRAFLERKGILRILDGSWLLQVEPESYDILLDRIPWSIGIIKLPWMREVLSVQWS